jgi:hypothetical protein
LGERIIKMFLPAMDKERPDDSSGTITRPVMPTGKDGCSPQGENSRIACPGWKPYPVPCSPENYRHSMTRGSNRIGAVETDGVIPVSRPAVPRSVFSDGRIIAVKGLDPKKQCQFSGKIPEFPEFYTGESVREAPFIQACLEGRLRAGSSSGRVKRKEVLFLGSG